MSGTNRENYGELMRVKDFASAVNVHRRTVRNWALARKIAVKWLPNTRFKVYAYEVDRINKGAPHPETATGLSTRNADPSVPTGG